MTSNQFFRNLWVKPQVYIFKNQNKLFSIKTETDLTCEIFQPFSKGQLISESHESNNF